MAQGIENIGKKDLAWSYAATIFTIGAGVLLLPFILNKLSDETVGIWTIFQTIAVLVMMLDFGFRPSFARNISYIFSGAKHLQVNGVQHIDGNLEVDYGLLSATLVAMRRFYRWMALGVFILLASVGTIYMWHILGKYSGDRTDALVAWVLLIVINSYNLYTLYYDALLIGKGYVKQNQQITIIGQALYLGVAIGLIYAGFGLTAIVSAQLISTLVRRIIMFHIFFTQDMKAALEPYSNHPTHDPKQIMQTIMPNAVKIGLTQLGGFCVNKSAVLIGSAFLSLEQMACYGLTVQVMDILARCSTVFYQSYTPKLAQCRTQNDLPQLRHYYLLSTLNIVVIYAVGGLCWILLGDWALGIIHSQTSFVPTIMLAVMLVISLLEHNHSTAAGFIMADNKIPFFIPSLVSGAATVLLLYVFVGLLHWGEETSTINGLWALILAPGIAQLAYQNWKWPSVVIKELKVRK